VVENETKCFFTALKLVIKLTEKDIVEKVYKAKKI